MAGRGKGAASKDFTATLTEDEQKLLDEAMASSATASGAASLPVNPVINPKNVMDPVVQYHPKASPVATEFPAQVYAAGRVLADAENPYSQVDPSIQLAAHEMAGWLAQNAPLPPPAVTQIDGRQVVVPAEVRGAPNRLKAHNEESARKWWKFFTGELQGVMTDWAARRGLSTDPLVALSDKLYVFLEGKDFQAREDKAHPYNGDEAHPQGPIMQGLAACFSQHTARIMVRMCERSNCSIMSGLKQCYAAILQEEADILRKAQIVQTGVSWKE